MALDVGLILRLSRDLQRATTIGELLAATQEAVTVVTPYRSCALTLVEPGPPRMVRILAITGAPSDLAWEHAPTFSVDGDAMVEQIVSSVEPVIVEDARTDPRTDKAMVERLGNRTIINVPLLIGSNNLGALMVGTYAPEEPRPPTPQELEHLVVFATQVTEAVQRLRLMNQQRTLQRQLEVAQRLESLAVLAGGVAHDFNNLLTTVVASASFVRMGPLTPEQIEDLDALDAAVGRASRLTRQLLALGRDQPLQLAEIDVGERVRATVDKLVRRLLPESIVVEVEVPASLPPILADAGQIDQVLINLCINARDAMRDGGRLVVRVEDVVHSGGGLGGARRMRPGRHVCISVMDTGHGIPPEQLDRIFEPFFTTKAQTVGSGLGLAVALGIVEQHQGGIECASTPGAGTTFRVYLPVSDHARGPSASPKERTSRPGQRGEAAARAGSTWVLLAEDDPAVRQAVRRALEGAGYRVVAVEDGQGAIDEASRRRFDLVLLDVVMPKATGREAWERIRAAQPDTRFLMMSGYTADVFGRDARTRDAEIVMLAKPFSPATLLEAVAGLLGSP